MTGKQEEEEEEGENVESITYGFLPPLARSDLPSGLSDYTPPADLPQAPLWHSTAEQRRWSGRSEERERERERE